MFISRAKELKAGCHTRSRGSGDGSQRLEKDHKFLLLVGYDLLGVGLTSATYSTRLCTLREFGTDGLTEVLIWRELFVFKNTGRCFPKCISLIFKSFSALLSYWKQAWLKNNSTEQIPFIVYNFNSLEMCRKCSYWVHANGLGQNDAQYVKSTFCNRVSFFFFYDSIWELLWKEDIGTIIFLECLNFPLPVPFHRCAMLTNTSPVLRNINNSRLPSISQTKDHCQ